MAGRGSCITIGKTLITGKTDQRMCLVTQHRECLIAIDVLRMTDNISDCFKLFISSQMFQKDTITSHHEYRYLIRFRSSLILTITNFV